MDLDDSMFSTIRWAIAASAFAFALGRILAAATIVGMRKTELELRARSMKLRTLVSILDSKLLNRRGKRRQKEVSNV